MNFFRKYFKGDPNIWAIIVGLSVFSILAVYSSTGTLAHRYSEGNTAFYILRHSQFLFIGLITAFVLHMFPYKYYVRLSQWLLIVAIPLLVVTLFFGVNENDATRRISIMGLTFQTSDLAKMALIMFIAQKLSCCQDNIRDFRKTLLPMYLITGIVCLLILPANFSTAFLLFVTCISLMFTGRVSTKQLSALCAVTLIIGSVLVGGLYGLQKAGVENVVTRRADTWVGRMERFFSDENPDISRSENYQAEQARIAVGTSSFFGKGPGKSIQRNFLPHPYSDFIFAIIIEEWGLFGGIIILFLYLGLLYRTILIVRKCDKTFPAFLAAGLSISIMFQAMINMAVSVGLMPVTGQPLPFISMGGTSILFTGAAFGIILSISRDVKRQEEMRMRKEVANQTGETEYSAQTI
jgi:cell division protein FtsW